jgi:FKBP-type peptidyl-prolyl cis-trans isomerase 2
VFIHYTLAGPSGEPLESTRREHGAAGAPRPHVLGLGARTLRGIEIGLSSMTTGQRCALELWPEYAFRHKGWSGRPPPLGLSLFDPVTVDVQLIHWVESTAKEEGRSDFKAVGDGGAVFKRELVAGAGWETPRPPFEIVLKLTARTLSSSGREREGTQYFSAGMGAGEEPLSCQLGKGALPRGLETALSSMAKGEKALVMCPADQATGGDLVPPPPLPDSSVPFQDVAGCVPAPLYVEFEAELLDFSHVRDLVGDGSATKRVLRKGRGEFPMDCPIADSPVEARVRVRAARPRGEWIPLRLPSQSSGSLLDVDVGREERSERDLAPALPALPLMRFETGMDEVPEALDAALRLMLRGEVAEVAASWSRAYLGRDDTPEVGWGGLSSCG